MFHPPPSKSLTLGTYASLTGWSISTPLFSSQWEA